jgi:hypothetical protein
LYLLTYLDIGVPLSFDECETGGGKIAMCHDLSPFGPDTSTQGDHALVPAINGR